MKGKLFILGIIATVLLVGCVGTLMVTWTTGRLFFEPAEKKARSVVQINPVAPLATPVKWKRASGSSLMRLSP